MALRAGSVGLRCEAGLGSRRGWGSSRPAALPSPPARKRRFPGAPPPVGALALVAAAGGARPAALPASTRRVPGRGLSSPLAPPSRGGSGGQGGGVAPARRAAGSARGGRRVACARRAAGVAAGVSDPGARRRRRAGVRGGSGYGGARRRLWTRAGPFSRISPATAPAGGPRSARGHPRRVASAGA